MSRSVPRIVVLTGNPRPASRTRTVARAVAERISKAIVADLAVDAAQTTGPLDIDLALLARDLFADTSHLVATALESVRDADVLIVATPVYKGSYTGLLKAFLDLLPSGGLAGVVAVPVIVSGAPNHQAVAEVHLRPLLAELGATVPTPAFSILEAQLPDLDAQVEGWTAANGGLIRASAAVLTTGGSATEAEFAR
ncbi:NAD(P)H-dependent oxidoreductase [Frankia sp. Cppng1_Ct_nod]|uniref:NADPH-dependent FMN reductase n=1 Tax=Frankia sp. Cppng1_Ct_nod TaxID=2897162 RepID=UPI00104121BE|nr:NAD(P)H-dependent oxidoreductase [Frankia sp. Cppng1_Ct_nod]